jgi:hypothetical protein
MIFLGARRQWGWQWPCTAAPLLARQKMTSVSISLGALRQGRWGGERTASPVGRGWTADKPRLSSFVDFKIPEVRYKTIRKIREPTGNCSTIRSCLYELGFQESKTGTLARLKGRDTCYAVCATMWAAESGSNILLTISPNLLLGPSVEGIILVTYIVSFITLI